MKLLGAATKVHHSAGMLLVECVTYIAVFAILLGVGFAAFYEFWDNSQAVIRSTDDIGAALRAGEGWRADVRRATGPITLEPSAAGESVRIPGPEQAIVYHFESGQVRREIPALHASRVVLRQVKSSRMIRETQGGVTAWRWELELAKTRWHLHLPLLFTFAAAQTTP